jgi:hypothetical protein
MSSVDEWICPTYGNHWIKHHAPLETAQCCNRIQVLDTRMSRAATGQAYLELYEDMSEHHIQVFLLVP